MNGTWKDSAQYSWTPRGPFSLEAARTLRCGFLRGSRACDAEEAVRVAFPRDGTFELVGARIEGDARRVTAELYGAGDLSGVPAQLARVLGLDHDARPFAKILDRVPALRGIARSRPGFRPVVSYSPYVMAGWCVLSQRLRMSQAAAIQVRIAEAAGDMVEVAGEALPSFPRPQTLLSLPGFPGVSSEKWVRLHAVARAALDGELSVEALLGRPYEESRERLMRIPGVGPWTAEGVLIRGCGTPDVLPLGEPMLHGAVQRAYGLRQLPADAEVRELAEAWRPFRTWVSVFLISEHFDALKQRSPGSVRVPNAQRHRRAVLRSHKGDSGVEHG
jgi:DNA-3-methyladenine glycosylase II